MVYRLDKRAGPKLGVVADLGAEDHHAGRDPGGEQFRHRVSVGLGGDPFAQSEIDGVGGGPAFVDGVVFGPIGAVEQIAEGLPLVIVGHRHRHPSFITCRGVHTLGCGPRSPVALSGELAAEGGVLHQLFGGGV